MLSQLIIRKSSLIAPACQYLLWLQVRPVKLSHVLYSGHKVTDERMFNRKWFLKLIHSNVIMLTT